MVVGDGLTTAKTTSVGESFKLGKDVGVNVDFGADVGVGNFVRITDGVTLTTRSTGAEGFDLKLITKNRASVKTDRAETAIINVFLSFFIGTGADAKVGGNLL